LHRPKAIQNAAVGRLQSFNRLQDFWRRRVEFVLIGRAVIYHRDDIGSDCEQQWAKLVVQLARDISPVIVLNGDYFAHQTAIFTI
jgi:hypothetical protein